MIDCLPLPASLSPLGRPCFTQFSTFPQLRVKQWIESPLPLRLPPKLPPADWPPPCTPPTLHDYGLQNQSITTSKCIPKLARSRTRSASLSSLAHGLHMDLQRRSIMVGKLARSRPPSAFSNSHDHGLQVHLQTRSIIASKCISKLAWLWRPNSLNHDLQVRIIKASKCISKFAQSPSRGASVSWHIHGLQVSFQIHSITAS